MDHGRDLSHVQGVREAGRDLLELVPSFQRSLETADEVRPLSVGVAPVLDVAEEDRQPIRRREDADVEPGVERSVARLEVHGLLGLERTVEPVRERRVHGVGKNLPDAAPDDVLGVGGEDPSRLGVEVRQAPVSVDHGQAVAGELDAAPGPLPCASQLGGVDPYPDDAAWSPVGIEKGGTTTLDPTGRAEWSTTRNSARKLSPRSSAASIAFSNAGRSAGWIRLRNIAIEPLNSPDSIPCNSAIVASHVSASARTSQFHTPTLAATSAS